MPLRQANPAKVDEAIRVLRTAVARDAEEPADRDTPPSSNAVSWDRQRNAPVRTEAGGELLIALFTDESSWLKDAAAERTVRADRDTVQVTFEELPTGRYAVAVIHDENGNGELDTRTFPFPKPTEGLAVSNNTWGFGRPDWAPAVFDLGADPVELQLELRYF